MRTFDAVLDNAHFENGSSLSNIDKNQDNSVTQTTLQIPKVKAKLNGHDPFLYLKDVLSRLPTQPNSRIGELLPHRWLSESAA